jgi:hypothetical protein
MTGALRPNRRRGRRTVLWAVLCFAALQGVGTWLMDGRWLHLRFPNAAGVLTHVRTQPRSPDILCLGSSRFGAAFLAPDIQHQLRDLTGNEELCVINASVAAGDLVTADFLLERMLETGARPRILVLEVSPETVARRNVWLAHHVENYLSWKDLPRFLGEIRRSRNLKRLVRARSLPWYFHRRQIWHEGFVWLDRQHCRLSRTLSATAGNTTPNEPIPWDRKIRDLTGEDLPPEQRKSLWIPMIREWLKEYRVGGTAADSLERVLERCRRERIKVFLVAPPVTEEHRALYTPEIQEAFLALMSSVQRHHGCTFLDYRARVPDHLFIDNHHVQPEGGEHFSQALTLEVLGPSLAAAGVDIRRDP